MMKRKKKFGEIIKTPTFTFSALLLLFGYEIMNLNMWIYDLKF